MKEFIIRTGIFDRKRKLILSEEYLEYEDKDFIGNEFSRFDKCDIQDFKHTRDRIVWYEFSVGQRFTITFKSKQNKEIKISFDSYLGLREVCHNLYSTIVETTWQYYHASIVECFLNRFYNGEELEIQGIKINNTGVILKDHHTWVPWDKLGMSDYERYFVVHHKDNPQLHSRVNSNEYGSETLWSLLRTISKDKVSPD
ncbi:MAG TPA: hypothetical protein VK589_30390 [Chryseolinea sp.]|nr:hypothetical protein [Chryseolinea sp.]